jgi:hypothetical protein
LLDKTLSKWETYQSFYHKVGYKGKPPVDSNGAEIQPIGYNVNKNNVFSVVMENGATSTQNYWRDLRLHFYKTGFCQLPP